MGSVLPLLTHLPMADFTDRAELPCTLSKDLTSESFSTRQSRLLPPVRLGSGLRLTGGLERKSRRAGRKRNITLLSTNSIPRSGELRRVGKAALIRRGSWLLAGPLTVPFLPPQHPVGTRTCWGISSHGQPGETARKWSQKSHPLVPAPPLAEGRQCFSFFLCKMETIKPSLS